MINIIQQFEDGTLKTPSGELVTSRRLAVLMDAEQPQKGVAGEGTGADTRAAIRAKLEQGFTHEDIANDIGRDVSIIGKILSGEVANPPYDLAAKIRASTK